MLPEVVRADEKRVRQILINLLGNAIKFTAQGQVTFRLKHAREMASIEIQDTGPGVPAEELARIFEPFTRSAAPGPAAPGAGLGLTIAKMLTDLMGGELTASSTPGVGSVFRVKLFLPEAHVSSRSLLPRPAQQRRGYVGTRRRILVVDNEEADRELLQSLLEPLGFELRTAASGHDCLDLLAAGYQPDVILMDLAMPGIDGWETIRRLRGLVPPPQAAVAVVSANAFDKGLDNDAGIPPEDFILKPVRHSELLDWLERKLAITWLDSTPVSTLAPIPVTAPAALVLPSPSEQAALLDVINLGYYRGIMNKLAEIEAAAPECAAFAEQMRGMARQFQFEAMGRLLQQAG